MHPVLRRKLVLAVLWFWEIPLLGVSSVLIIVDHRGRRGPYMRPGPRKLVLAVSSRFRGMMEEEKNKHGRKK